jgi:hypothetical protein
LPAKEGKRVLRTEKKKKEKKLNCPALFKISFFKE